MDVCKLLRVMHVGLIGPHGMLGFIRVALPLHPFQDNIVIHDPSYLNAEGAADGSNLPSFDVKRIQEFFKHSTHHPDPLKPIEVWGTEVWSKCMTTADPSVHQYVPHDGSSVEGCVTDGLQVGVAV